MHVRYYPPPLGGGIIVDWHLYHQWLQDFYARWWVTNFCSRAADYIYTSYDGSVSWRCVVTLKCFVCGHRETTASTGRCAAGARRKYSAAWDGGDWQGHIWRQSSLKPRCRSRRPAHVLGAEQREKREIASLK